MIVIPDNIRPTGELNRINLVSGTWSTVGLDMISVKPVAALITNITETGKAFIDLSGQESDAVLFIELNESIFIQNWSTLDVMKMSSSELGGLDVSIIFFEPIR